MEMQALTLMHFERYIFGVSAAFSFSILVRPLLTTTIISWNKTEKIVFLIPKVYVHIYIVLLIVYLQFGEQLLLVPLIMSGVVRVRVQKALG